VAGPRLLFACAVLAVASLNGCATGDVVEAARGAYEFYDAHLEREVVAGRDDARGNYYEVRWSPRSPAPTNAGGTPALLWDGKAVRP
jgi:hypothetical protein